MRNSLLPEHLALMESQQDYVQFSQLLFHLMGNKFGNSRESGCLPCKNLAFKLNLINAQNVMLIS